MIPLERALLEARHLGVLRAVAAAVLAVALVLLPGSGVVAVVLACVRRWRRAPGMVRAGLTRTAESPVTRGARR